jgi:hypothetical protein
MRRGSIPATHRASAGIAGSRLGWSVGSVTVNAQMDGRVSSKYRNKKTTLHGLTFDSKAEAKRYLELVMLQNTGAITNLELQVPFELIPKQGNERPCTYIADFVYFENGERVVEDLKSPATRKKPDYVIKRKLLLFRHGIRLKESGRR